MILKTQNNKCNTKLKNLHNLLIRGKEIPEIFCPQSPRQYRPIQSQQFSQAI
jgi:hypothetical protein